VRNFSRSAGRHRSIGGFGAKAPASRLLTKYSIALSSADVRLDCDRVYSHPDDGDPGHTPRTYICCGHLSTLAEARDIIAVMAAEDRRTRAPGSSVGYAIVLLGAVLFVATCFLPYYGLPGGQSASLYDQLLVAQDGGWELGAKLFMFGGVATIVVVALVGLTRGERSSGRAFLAGAVAAWSLTWIGSLLQTVSLRGGGTIGGLSLKVGFWLQAVSIGVTVMGTILLATRPTGAHERSRVGTSP
jgi:hypothetical protein